MCVRACNSGEGVAGRGRETETDRQTNRQTYRDRERQAETESQRQRKDSNSKTLFYKYCSSIQFNSKNFNHPTRGNFVVVMAGS